MSASLVNTTQLQGGAYPNSIAISNGTYNAKVTDMYILASTAYGGVTVNLPIGVGGQVITIQKTSYDTANYVNVTNGTINGLYGNILLTTHLDTVTMICTSGGAWSIVSRSTNTMPQSYTPTFNIPITSQFINSWRQGQYLKIKGSIQTGTTNGSGSYFTIGFQGVDQPANVVVNTSLIPGYPSGNSIVGTWGAYNTANSYGYVVTNGGYYLYFSLAGAQLKDSAWNAMGGNSNIIDFTCEVPINLWSSPGA